MLTPLAGTARGLPARGVHETSPAARWEDAFVAGNGRHGALAYGRPWDEEVVITHHDLVRPNGCAERLPPRLADRLAGVRDLLLAGESAQALDRFCAGWPEWMPQPFHPAFALRLRLAPSPGSAATTRLEHPRRRSSVAGTSTLAVSPAEEYLRAADFSTGLLSTAWCDAAGQWRRGCFVSRARDVVVQWLDAPPGAGLDMELRHEVLLPGAPSGLAVSWPQPPGDVAAPAGPGDTAAGAVVLLRVDYPAPVSRPAASEPGASEPRASEPAGRAGGYVGATRIVAAGGEYQLTGGVARIRGGRGVLLLTRVARYPAGADPGALLRAMARDLTALPADRELLLAEHVRIHGAAFERVRLDLGASPADRRLPAGELLDRQAAEPDRPLPVVLEKLFDSGRYLLLSASGQLPPRLPGLWQGDWHAAWSGAIVSNANLNLQLAGAVSTDVPEAVLALADMIDAHLADWRVNASRLYGARGILAPAQSDGRSGLAGHFAAAYPHHMWTAGADWLLVPLLDYVDATGDEGFLRDRVLPALTELARFYEDFLGWRGAGQPVLLAPSYSPENQPAGWTAAAVNATMDIAAARHALTAAAAGCARLGVEGGPGGGIGRWQALARRLPGYRLNAAGALAEWAWPPAGPPLGDRDDHRHVSHLYPVWPLHDITVADTPSLAAAALRALRRRGTENGSAHGYLHQALAAARLRDGELAGQRLAALTGGGFFFRSLMSSHYPGRRVYNADAACAVPAVLTEMLVDSVAARGARPGRLELLPAVPGYLRAGRLTGIRTLTQATVDLAWDLAARSVTATVRSRSGQLVDLVCWRAVSCRSDAIISRLAPGTWRLRLPAGAATALALEMSE